MTKRFFPHLAVLLGLLQLSQAQTHELTFKAGQAFHNSSHAPLNSRYTDSKSVDKGFGADLGYGHYFKNDNYVRLSGSYVTTSSVRKGSGGWGNIYNEWNYEEKEQRFGGNIELGRRLSYKFIDFLAGVGVGYSVSPSYQATDHYITRQMPGNSNSLAESYNKTVTTMPGANEVALYLNTSLYFKICKPLYLGIEVGNGFNYRKQKGDQVLETTQSVQSGMAYVDRKQIPLDESRFTMQVFRTRFAVRYVFGLKKAANVPEQTS